MPERIHFAGNVMIDSLLRQLPDAVPPRISVQAHGHDCPPAYALLTLHRPSNVDDGARLAALMEVDVSAVGAAAAAVSHPSAHARHAGKDRAGAAAARARHRALPPLGYLEMLGLMQGARLVLTDSGGIQEETTALGVPCLTLRDNTERPVTVDEGSNTIAGTDPAAILSLARQVLRTGGKRGRIPQYWDGHAAERIATATAQWLRGAAWRHEPARHCATR